MEWQKTSIFWTMRLLLIMGRNQGSDDYCEVGRSSYASWSQTSYFTWRRIPTSGLWRYGYDKSDDDDDVNKTSYMI